jgi:hypothetical protein
MRKELSVYEREERDEAYKVVHALSNYVNKMGHSTKFLVEAMGQEHRTLQQSITNVMLRWLVHLSELDDNYYDLRNSASVKIAKEIVAAVPDIKYGVPLI